MEKRPPIEKMASIASFLGRIGAKIGNLFGSTKGQTGLPSALGKQQLTSLSFVRYRWPPTDGDGQLSFEEATRALPGLLVFLERSCYGDSIYCLLEHSEAFNKFLYVSSGGRVMKYCEIPDWVQSRIRQLASGPRS